MGIRASEHIVSYSFRIVLQHHAVSLPQHGFLVTFPISRLNWLAVRCLASVYTHSIT